jgi:pyrrolidone-carboxylate peptidase
MTPTTVLLTGLEPFGGETTNPSWSAVQEVRRTWAGLEQLHILDLPVDFGTVTSSHVSSMLMHSIDGSPALGGFVHVPVEAAPARHRLG